MTLKIYLASCVVWIACSLAMALLITGDAKSEELPKIPLFEEMLGWQPQADRTMEVVFPGIRFRYSILDFKAAPGCQAVVEMPLTEELRWVTQAGMLASQYLTRSHPMAFKRDGDAIWHWMNIKTYKEK